jgi:hypothetical protein
MITLSPASITTTTAVFNEVSTVTTTDTLRVSYVELNLPAGSVVAMLDRGTMVDGIFTPNQPRLRVDVAADGRSVLTTAYGQAHCQTGLWHSRH